MSVHGPSGQSDSGALESSARSTPIAANEPQLTRWQKFRMVVKVVELRLRFVALMAATGLVFAYWDTLWNHYEKWTRPPGETHAAASDTEHFCPMHPTVIQAEPGSCPICGMPLSKRKKGEQETLPAGVLARVSLAPFRVAQDRAAQRRLHLRLLAHRVLIEEEFLDRLIQLGAIHLRERFARLHLGTREIHEEPVDPGHALGLRRNPLE